MVPNVRFSPLFVDGDFVTLPRLAFRHELMNGLRYLSGILGLGHHGTVHADKEEMQNLNLEASV